MRVATKLKSISGMKGEAFLYRCDPPMLDYDNKVHEYVVVSAAFAAYSGPETYIFPANADGEITDWGEMPGSFQGSYDHNQALRNANYEPKGETDA